MRPSLTNIMIGLAALIAGLFLFLAPGLHVLKISRGQWLVAALLAWGLLHIGRSIFQFFAHSAPGEGQARWHALFWPPGKLERLLRLVGVVVVVALVSLGISQPWAAPTLKPLLALSGHHSSVRSAAFSSDGKRVVTASTDKTARLWDDETGAAIARLRGHEELVWSAAFSPDGKRVVTASDDKTARLWDGETGAAIATLRGHEDPVWSAAFSPDGKRVVTASVDETARLWDVATSAAVAISRGP
jgi:WD40 repeat protein